MHSQKTAFSVPCLNNNVLTQPKSATLQIQLDELLCVRLNCTQIILVQLTKQFLLPANHILFVVDHHNADLDVLTYNSHQGAKEK